MAKLKTVPPTKAQPLRTASRKKKEPVKVEELRVAGTAGAWPFPCSSRDIKRPT